MMTVTHVITTLLSHCVILLGVLNFLRQSPLCRPTVYCLHFTLLACFSSREGRGGDRHLRESQSHRLCWGPFLLVRCPPWKGGSSPGEQTPFPPRGCLHLVLHSVNLVILAILTATSKPAEKVLLLPFYRQTNRVDTTLL